MTYPIPCLLFFSCCLLLLLSVSKAESRPPHGPAYYKPTAFSPAAYDFFHPKAQAPESQIHSSTPLPLTANIEAETTQSNVSSQKHTTGHGVGAGATIGILLGLTFAAFSAMGVYFVMNKRRANIVRTISVRPEA